MRQLTVEPREAGLRLDHYLSRYLREAPQSFLCRMLRKKNITLNGKKADGSRRLAAGDVVTLFLSEETLGKFMGERPAASRPVRPAPPLRILYEDEDVIFLNKAVGELSQKAKADDVSVCEALLGRMMERGELTEESLRTFRPAVCHRLDRNTSGVLAAGKTTRGLQGLSALFRERAVEKRYLCLAEGEMRTPCHLTGRLTKEGRENRVTITADGSGVPVETDCSPIEISGGMTLLSVKLITGRTHQIRAQLAAAGHPLPGDGKYGKESVNRMFERRFSLHHPLLHSWKLSFPASVPSLPQLNGRVITAPLPDDFTDCLRELGFHRFTQEEGR